MRVLTDWFPATTKPARNGEYITRLSAKDALPTMLVWNGHCWHSKFGHVQYFNFEWRGLAFDPAAAEECDDAESPDPTNPRRGWWAYRNSVSQEMLEGIYAHIHWMPMPDPPDEPGRMWARSVCSQCHGTGMIGLSATCPYCDGSGLGP